MLWTPDVEASTLGDEVPLGLKKFEKRVVNAALSDARFKRGREVSEFAFAFDRVLY